MDTGMSRVHYELAKHKGGQRYQNLLKLGFLNPMIRFYYKLMFLAGFILLLKLFGRLVGSINYFSQSNNKEPRTHLMIKIEVSVKKKSFTLKDAAHEPLPQDHPLR